MSNTADHVKKYICHIEEQYGLSVTIHSLNDDFHLKFAEFNLHTNPYCLYIKTHEDIWDACVKLQKNVTAKCEKVGSFCGVCHAGVLEYVYPLTYDNNVIGFVCVSGYRPKKGDPLYDKAEEKLERLCRDYRLDIAEVKSVYETHLSEKIPDKELIDTLIEPICDMIRLDRSDDELIPKKSTAGEDALYYAVCNIIRRLHNSKLDLGIICQMTHYSKSHISHLFKKQSGKTVNQYTNELRIAEAKTLLDSTTMPIQEIALSVGFSDANYFSNVFKASNGLSPREYRNLRNKQNDGV